MKHYEYTQEVKDVLEALKEVRGAKKHEKLYAEDGVPEEHVPILRQAYKTALKVVLFNLHTCLEIWISHGCKIEDGDKEVGS